MDIPRGLRSASKAQLLELACHLAGTEATLAQACRSIGAHDVAKGIKVPESSMGVRQVGTQWVIEGETFAVKDVLKRRGGRWNGMANAWGFASSQEAQAAVEECVPILAVRLELAALEAS